VYLRYLEVKCDGFQEPLTGSKRCKKYRGTSIWKESMSEADRFAKDGAK
jgi:hypothetical protein